MIKIILMLFCLMLLCCACSNLNVGVAPVLKAGAAAATGYAAYEIAPDEVQVRVGAQKFMRYRLHLCRE